MALPLQLEDESKWTLKYSTTASTPPEHRIIEVAPSVIFNSPVIATQIVIPDHSIYRCGWVHQLTTIDPGIEYQAVSAIRRARVGATLLRFSPDISPYRLKFYLYYWLISVSILIYEFV